MGELTLTAETLAALAQKPGVAREFPFLARLARPSAPTGCCPAAAGGGPDWARAVEQVFALPPDRRAAFKAAAGAAVVWRRVVRAGRATREAL